MTLKEMDAQTAQHRERMWKRDVLTREVTNARNRVASIEEKVSKPEPAIAALEDIIALAQDVPAGLTTRGDRLTPGGHDARYVLEQIAANALADVRAKRKVLEQSLPVAKEALASAEQALAKFN